MNPASGGVGLAALQTCRKVGATSVGTTRNRAKADALRKAGADHVIVTGEEDLKTRIYEISEGKGVRIVFNALTGDILTTLVDVTRPGGTIFMFGGIGGKPTPLPFGPLITKGVRIQGYTVYELTYHTENLPFLREYVSEGIRDGDYTAIVGKVFPFQEMAEVHRYLEAGDISGSVVVTV